VGRILGEPEGADESGALQGGWRLQKRSDGGSTLASAGKRRQRSKDGDLFAVPLQDGRYAFGQVVASIDLGCLSCVFFRATSIDANAADETDEPIAFLFVTKELLSSGRWQIVRNAKIHVRRSLNKNERFRRWGWVGATVTGSANVEALLNAFNGLKPWDNWKDPKYLDSLLLDPRRKPPNLVYVRGAVS
jgi:hypothetical protein